MKKIVVLVGVLALYGCSSSSSGTHDTETDASTPDSATESSVANDGEASDAPIDPTGKFNTLADLLANSKVQDAIARLPAGDGVTAGNYYKGSTPADVTGVWSTDCCGGSRGTWPQGNQFGGTITYHVVSPGHVDVPSYTSQLDIEDGTGSFIVGTGNDVTVFLQLAVTCTDDGEHVRAVAVDRFIYGPTKLSQYVRSYVVLARDNPAGPWSCFADEVGSGSTSTVAVFGKQS